MNRLIYPLIFIFLCLLNGVGYCQPGDAVYAGSESHGGTFEKGAITGAALGVTKVDNPKNAIDTVGNIKPNSNFAHLSATATLGTITTTYLQLIFINAVPVNSTVYVKTKTSSLSLLTGGRVALSYVNTSGATTSITDYKTFYTADGNMYFSLSPSASLKSLRITISTSTLLGDVSMDIYYAFYGPTAVNDTNPFPSSVADCGLPNVTTTAFSGVTVLGSLSVANPGNAIDDDVNTFAAYNTSGVSAAGHIIQTFHFNGASNLGDAVKVVFSKGSSLLNVNVAKAITIRGYNGSNPTVGTTTALDLLLDADLLGLLTSGSTVITAYFAPKDNNSPIKFDRVTVDFDLGLLGISLNGNGLNVFDVRRVPDVPTASNATACTNVGTINLAATTILTQVANIGSFTYKWYNAVRQGTLLGTLVGQVSFLATGLTTVGNKDYYVDITKSGCTVPSGRTKVTVNIINPPITPPVALVP